MSLPLPVTPVRGLPEVGPPPAPQKTLSRWDLFLGSIASAMPLADAMLKHYISRADIETCVRSSVEERVKWGDARAAALRKNWSEFDFEDVFERIAGGMPVTQAVQEVKPNSHNEFLRLVVADEDINGRYMRALKSRSLVMSEDIIEIADDKSNDTLEGPKGTIPNQAAVNRDKLRVETRARLMAAWNTRMFGESKNQVQVNVQVNHAERLEEARARANTRSASKQIPQRVLDAAFTDVVPEDDLSWLDEEKPDYRDTTWLEQA